MVINLAAHTIFDVDTVSGTVSLTRAQLQGLTDGNYTTNVVTLSGSDILVLDVDLGQRIATQDLRYYFDSATASGTVASGILWYYKNYDSNPWYPLTTSIEDGYYTTTTFSGVFYPNYIRLVHTISGTGITGSVREFEVNSNDDIVDFGTDGTLTEKALSETPIGSSSAYPIPIYNDSSKSATAHVYIGNTDTDADEMLEISNLENGTYISVDDNLLIDGGVEGLQWGLGDHDGTSEDNDKLVLDSFGGSYYTEGTYTTPVFKNVDPTYWRVRAEIPEDTNISTSENAISPTIEVRSSNIAPETTYKLVISRYAGSSRIFDLYDQDGFDLELYSHSHTQSTMDAIATNPHNNQYARTNFFYCGYTDDDDTYIKLFDVDGNLIDTSEELFSQAFFSERQEIRRFAVDKNNGAFCYVWKGAGDEADAVMYVNSGLEKQWHRRLTVNNGGSAFNNNLDLASDLETAWYVDASANTVYRIDKSNVIQTTIPGLSSPRGIICNDVDGVWILDTAADLAYEYDNDGILKKSFPIVDGNITWTFKDFYGGFWFINKTNNTIYRYDSDGNQLLAVPCADPDTIYADVSGCWYTSGDFEKFEHINLDGIIDISYTGVDVQYVGSFSWDIDGLGYTYPNDSDYYWGTDGAIEWSEVSKDNNFIHHKEYHQARITLRGDGSDTPEVEKIALPPTVTLYNIGAQSYKNVYLKTNVPDGTNDDLRQGKIRTWFSVEE